jgi:preprotein translocase subunit SecA
LSATYENVVVPITDGARTYNVITNLKAAVESNGKELLRSFEKTSVLANIDESWKEHLREMDDLKQSVQNATYEQKDPLLIYKFESFELFKNMINKVNQDVVSLLMKGVIPVTSDNVREAQRRKQADMSRLRTQKSDFDSYRDGSGGPPDKRQQQTAPVRVEKKVGRNDPCPCGSGKKYKHCHGANIDSAAGV